MRNEVRLSVTLLTGRTIEQGVGKERGKASKEYAESVTVCFIDPQDMKKLKVKEGANVEVSTSHGSIVLKSVKSRRGPHPGIVFVPYGPWANVIVDSGTDSIGMPSLKGIPAEIESAPEKSVLDLPRLLAQLFGNE
ncbi:MAG: molybdopterin dinucleotide binding domain-containing protein [Candidatus Bathyarchaeia archaeon]|jgi:formylmethanofuran dehydrogenase subunit D